MTFGLKKNIILHSIQGVLGAQPSQAQPSGIEVLAKTVNSVRPTAVFAEIFVFDVWLGSQCASGICKVAP